MGMDLTTAEFVKELKVNWSSTLTVGRQNWWLSKRESQRVGCPIDYYSRSRYSEPFFRMLGANVLESVDLSEDEGPTFTADLSMPGALADRRYSAICDFGTAEHIADQPTYWRNLWNALDPFGSLIVVVPANQLCGHGLYQYSPEFFTSMGGFGLRYAEVVEYGWNVRRTVFDRSGRFELRTRRPTYVFAHLVKGRELPFLLPVQSDNAQTTHRKQRNEQLMGMLLGIPFVRNLQRVL